jgi:hypothetical protein
LKVKERAVSETKTVGPLTGQPPSPDLNTSLGMNTSDRTANPTAAVLAFIAGQPMSVYTEGPIDVRTAEQVARVKQGKDEYMKNLAA